MAPAQLNARSFAARILTYRSRSQSIKQKRDCSQSTPIQIVQKKISRKGKLNEKNSCTPINPKKYSCYGLKNVHTRNLITKKHSCGSKIPLPAYNFSNGPSLTSMGFKQHVTVPTHISGHTLDLLITREYDPVMRLCYAL